MAINSLDFQFIADLARREAAIVLEPGKEYLVEGRLSPLAREAGFSCLEEFIDNTRRDRANRLVNARIIDALTTNETYFFRDHHPFEALRTEILPKLIALRQNRRQLTIWSAACSTGQEIYSIAMLIRENFPQLGGWDVKLYGTDISPRVLAQARAGEYNQIEVNRGLPAKYLVKYFKQNDEYWIIRDDIRAAVEFREMNLIQLWTILPPCDIILLRNVMIYFDVPTKQTILQNVRRQLVTDGYFFLGSAETTMNLDPKFSPVTIGRTVVYQQN